MSPYDHEKTDSTYLLVHNGTLGLNLALANKIRGKMPQAANAKAMPIVACLLIELMPGLFDAGGIRRKLWLVSDFKELGIAWKHLPCHYHCRRSKIDSIPAVTVECQPHPFFPFDTADHFVRITRIRLNIHNTDDQDCAEIFGSVKWRAR